MLSCWKWDYIEKRVYDYTGFFHCCYYSPVMVPAIVQADAVEVPTITMVPANNSGTAAGGVAGGHSIRGPTYGAYTKHCFIT